MKNQDFAAKDRQKLTGYRETNYKGLGALTLLLCAAAITWALFIWWVLK